MLFDNSFAPHTGLDMKAQNAHIQAMKKAASSSLSPKLVRDPRTGDMLEVRGYGALKGRLKIAPGVDLTKPIYEQVTDKAVPKTSAQKR